MKNTIIAALALALVAPASVLEAQESLGRDQEVWTWTGPLAAGQWASGHSVNGAVRFERSADNQVHIRAEKKWRRGDPREVSFTVIRGTGGLTVCVLRDQLDSCTESGIRSQSRNRRQENDASADITIQVPRGVHVAARTVNGGVRVEGMNGEVKASTVNGGVAIATSGGSVSATTVNGSVRVALGRAAREAMRFKTVNGSVEVTLPADTRADLDISTVNGRIDTEFPVTITGRWGPKSARGTINGGGERIEISTVNGGVRLRKAEEQ